MRPDGRSMTSSPTVEFCSSGRLSQALTMRSSRSTGRDSAWACAAGASRAGDDTALTRKHMARKTMLIRVLDDIGLRLAGQNDLLNTAYDMWRRFLIPKPILLGLAFRRRLQYAAAVLSLPNGRYILTRTPLRASSCTASFWSALSCFSQPAKYA